MSDLVSVLQEMQEDLKNQNPSDLFHKYKDAFRDVVLTNTITLKKGGIYYRGREGVRTLTGAIDDLDIEFHYPYYNKDILNPPAYMSRGTRFNRSGYSYLYVLDRLDACFAELRIKVGALCSISKFTLNEEVTLFDIEKVPELKEFMLKPVYDDNHSYYSYTRFFAEVVKYIGVDGIIYETVQADYGNCIVCFYPNKFEVVPNSERMYKATRVIYKFEEYEPEYKKYPGYNHLLNTYNQDEDERKDRVFEHILNNDEI